MIKVADINKELQTSHIIMEPPANQLRDIACRENIVMNSEQFAKLMDANDELRHIRDLFEYPKMKVVQFIDLSLVDGEEDSIYLCGNSLGLMPKAVRRTMDQLMQQWSDLGVYGHHYGEHPWFICDEDLLPTMARLVGGTKDEVAIMNQLTSNLHFLLLSFYRPTEKRFKIIFENKAFPSDYYAFESQVKLHGFDPNEALITLKPRPGEYNLKIEDIEQAIRLHGEQISVVCFSGVQFYTGQCFDIERITRCGHEVGAYVGWDLAHSIGNVELDLHNWDVDFAVWTTYKYVNAGAGNIGGAFLHEKHFNADLPYLTGWWGNRIEVRMAMTNQMEPGVGIRKYRMSTPSAIHCAVLRASLEIFDSVTMAQVRAKSVLLTAYLELLLNGINEQRGNEVLKIITPKNIDERGSQLSIVCMDSNVDDVHGFLKKRGLICDHRRPNVLRLAPCPLYNSFYDVFRATKVLDTVFYEDLA